MKNLLINQLPKLAKADDNTGFSGFSGFSEADPALSDAPGRFASIITNIVAILTIFAGLAFFLWFLVGALTWITASNDPKQLDKAKNQMGTAIVGLTIVILSIPIIYIIGKIIGFDIINFETIIEAITPN